MAVSAADIAHAVELFDGVGTITTRRMMGGLCLYADGTIFAILHPDDGLMLKCKGPLIAEVEAAGGRQWTYTRPGSDRSAAMPYWSLPETALDDPEEARRLARAALAELR